MNDPKKYRVEKTGGLYEVVCEGFGSVQTHHTEAMAECYASAYNHGRMPTKAELVKVMDEEFRNYPVPA